MSRKYPKILVVGEPFNTISGTGITLTNFFKEWPKDKIGLVAGNNILRNDFSFTTNVYKLKTFSFSKYWSHLSQHFYNSSKEGLLRPDDVKPSQKLIITELNAEIFIIRELKKQFKSFSKKLISFFGLSVISSGFEQMLYSVASVFEKTWKGSFYNYNPNILIYTISNDRVIEGSAIFKRNAGPFWEAGGYGAYLIVAFLFSLAKGDKLLNKRNIVFVFAMITTWSTGTFVALFAILFFYYLWLEKSKFAHWLMLPVVILISFYALTELSFVSERIIRSLDYFDRRDEVIYERNRDRMVSGLVDINTFLTSPVFGTGRSFKARYGSNVNEFSYLEHRNNGLTDFLVKYGFIVFILYFYLYRRRFKSIAEFTEIKKRIRFSLMALIAIFLVGFTQVIFQQSVFIAIAFIGVFNSKQRSVFN